MESVSKYRPVSIGLGATLATVFGLYRSGKFQTLDCSNTYGATVKRDFIHLDTYHLLVNLLSLFYVSGLEAQIGSVRFLALVGSIVLIAALATMGITRLFNVKCSIGFSGIILGLMAFALLTGRKELNWVPLLYLVAVSVAPTGQNISVSGHLIGIATGVVLALGYRYALPPKEEGVVMSTISERPGTQVTWAR